MIITLHKFERHCYGGINIASAKSDVGQLHMDCERSGAVIPEVEPKTGWAKSD